MLAQDKPRTEKAPAQRIENDRIVQPAPQMNKLIRDFGGTWTTEDTYEPSPLMPKGGTARSRTTFRPGPGRLSLIQEYQADGSAGKSSGLGVIWWDDKAGSFRVVWCEAGDPPVESRYNGCKILAGGRKVEGDKYVDSDQIEIQGRTMAVQDVYSEFTPVSFTEVLSIGEPGGEMKPFLRIKYRKVADPHRGKTAPRP